MIQQKKIFSLIAQALPIKDKFRKQSLKMLLLL